MLLSIKPPKKHPTKPPKFATALVIFQKIQGAFGAVGASGLQSRGLENVDIAWAKGVEPEVVQRLRSQGKPIHSSNEPPALQGDRSPVSGFLSEVSRSPWLQGSLSWLLRIERFLYCARQAVGCVFARGARNANTTATTSS